jgi:dipeptidyl aminopeptidase/acylaminoacyl peptidase
VPRAADRPARPRVPLGALGALGALALLLAGCVDHALAHPRTRPPGVDESHEQRVLGKLLVRLEWAWPSGAAAARRPAVLVHPEAGHGADEMRAVLRDLAARGYVAVAADYRRAERGRYRDTFFTWRGPEDVRAVYDLVAADPRVDPDRIGLVGFSQGGVYSLLLAAETGTPAAVVAYYPVTDFAEWLAAADRTRRERLVFRLVRRHFYRQSGAGSPAAFEAMLARASPLAQAERIRAPVLLVHGDRDRSAHVAESRRLAARLGELGREVELLVVPDAGHVFNFRDERQAETAWRATVAWLDGHLRR